jgi:hypothetical protein
MATSQAQAQAALAEIKALGLNEVDTIKLIAEKAQEQGLSAEQVGNLLGISQEAVNRNLALAGIPSFDVGTNFVPYDMTANIHRGERIIPKADNAALLQDSKAMVDEMRGLRESVGRLERALVMMADHLGMKLDQQLNVQEDMVDALQQRKAVGSNAYAA